jgi:opacity protein-like surface antigen
MNVHFADSRFRRVHVPRAFIGVVASWMIWGAPNPVFADDEFDRSGPYIGISGVYQRNVFENRIEDLVQDAAAPIPVSLSIEDSGGVNAVAGYRLASFFAAELQYEWVDEYSIEGSVAGLSKLSVYDVSAHTLTANAKLILPFWRIQPYLVVGAGFSSWNIDRGPLAAPLELLDSDIDIKSGTQTDFAGRAGVGLDLYVTDNIVINAQGQVVLTTIEKPELDNIDDLNYVGFSLGLQYRF